jgi:SAM-dependent methyltransferase
MLSSDLKMATPVEELQSYLREKRKEAIDTRIDADELKREYEIQQDIYTRYAASYDDVHKKRQLINDVIIGDQIEKLFGDNKDINILDYGCGTGKVADDLATRGFKSIEGTEPNQQFVNLALVKGHMKKIYQLSSNDSHDALKQKHYEVICSSSTFFPSPSHPGFECFPKLCKLVKQGGYIIILTGKIYLNGSWTNEEVYKELEEKGMLKLIEKKSFDGYKKKLAAEETVEHGQGVILTYQILM